MPGAVRRRTLHRQLAEPLKPSCVQPHTCGWLAPGSAAAGGGLLARPQPPDGTPVRTGKTGSGCVRDASWVAPPLTQPMTEDSRATRLGTTGQRSLVGTARPMAMPSSRGVPSQKAPSYSRQRLRVGRQQAAAREVRGASAAASWPGPGCAAFWAAYRLASGQGQRGWKVGEGGLKRPPVCWRWRHPSGSTAACCQAGRPPASRRAAPLTHVLRRGGRLSITTWASKSSSEGGPLPPWPASSGSALIAGWPGLAGSGWSSMGRGSECEQEVVGRARHARACN